MTAGSVVVRGLVYYWRTNVAVVFGVAIAVAVLAGALIVGDSVRGSLRDLVLERIGRTDRVVLSSGFFREALADDVRVDEEFASVAQAICPLIVMPGMVSDQSSGRRASRIQVYGVDDRFWQFHGFAAGRGPNDRDALLSRALAADIGAAPGATILVRVERPSAIPIESLHGRKDNLGRTLRLTVRSVIGPGDLGDFSLQPQQGEVRAVFVPLRRLQEDLDVAGRANALLVADPPSLADTAAELGRASAPPGASKSPGPQRATTLDELIRRRFALEDVGLTIRTAGEVIVESAAGLIDGPRATSVDEAARAARLRPRPVLTYLANTMTIRDRHVPYSLVTAMDLSVVAPPATAPHGTAPPIVINDWAARELAAKVGDPLTLEYYVWEEPGRLLTRIADFEIVAIVPIAGAAADRDLAPVYPGITEAATLGDWDPPFPIDLKRVRRVDEDYWETYRTTPKAFVPLDVGQRLWGSRFGDRTSVRMAPAAGQSVVDARDQVAAALRSQIDPLAAGLSIRPVREEGLGASRGATDFAEYFTYFSFFLVMSALLLAVLFFRLSVEQRAREIGMLRALGFTTARVRTLLSAEAFVLAVAGSVIGAAGAVAYGAAMMAGLRTWWSGAVGTTAMSLHVNPASLATGGAGALTAGMLCIWWTLRRLSSHSERALLSGVRRPFQGRHAGLNGARYSGIGFALLGVALLSAGAFGAIDRAGAFFGSATLLLIACLCAITVMLRRPPRSSVGGSGWRRMARVGLRNAADRPGRSVLAIGVIASATFILVAVDGFRRDAPPAGDRRSGGGGYPLLVDLLVPLVNDPNSRDGLEALGLDQGDGIAIEPFRVMPGDDASCLNLYEPRNPRVMGVSKTFIGAGRFAFQSSLASTDAERANPWLLLDRDLGGDVVPVIADANSMTYVLHKKLGDEIAITRGARPVRLRLVAALTDSLFQSELLMGEDDFVRLFPEQEGYRYLLVDVPPARAAQTAAAIEAGAADLGADAAETSARLAEFHTVENTYLSTFQTLGGLGLLVGTLGLAAVVLRNVLDRRRELALLGAVGYGRGHIFTIVVAEHVLLLVWGLAIGTVCALVAIAPAALERGGRLPATQAGALLLVAVFVAGLLSSIIATSAALRTPLLAALRSE